MITITGIGDHLRPEWPITITGMRNLIAEVGVSQIVMGTDYPFPWTKTAVDHILTTPGLSDADRVAILGETAANLLAIKPA